MSKTPSKCVGEIISSIQNLKEFDRFIHIYGKLTPCPARHVALAPSPSGYATFGLCHCVKLNEAALPLLNRNCKYKVCVGKWRRRCAMCLFSDSFWKSSFSVTLHQKETVGLQLSPS